MDKAFLTADEAAAMLGVSPQQVRTLIRQGTLPATKHGRDWAIDPQALELEDVKVRKLGRPPKSEEGQPQAKNKVPPKRKRKT